MRQPNMRKSFFLTFFFSFFSLCLVFEKIERNCLVMKIERKNKKKEKTKESKK